MRRGGGIARRRDEIYLRASFSGARARRPGRPARPAGRGRGANVFGVCILLFLKQKNCTINHKPPPPPPPPCRRPAADLPLAADRPPPNHKSPSPLPLHHRPATASPSSISRSPLATRRRVESCRVASHARREYAKRHGCAAYALTSLANDDNEDEEEEETTTQDSGQPDNSPSPASRGPGSGRACHPHSLSPQLSSSSPPPSSPPPPRATLPTPEAAALFRTCGGEEEERGRGRGCSRGRVGRADDGGEQERLSPPRAASTNAWIRRGRRRPRRGGRQRRVADRGRGERPRPWPRPRRRVRASRAARRRRCPPRARPGTAVTAAAAERRVAARRCRRRRASPCPRRRRACRGRRACHRRPTIRLARLRRRRRRRPAARLWLRRRRRCAGGRRVRPRAHSGRGHESARNQRPSRSSTT